MNVKVFLSQSKGRKTSKINQSTSTYFINRDILVIGRNTSSRVFFTQVESVADIRLTAPLDSVTSVRWLPGFFYHYLFISSGGLFFCSCKSAVLLSKIDIYISSKLFAHMRGPGQSTNFFRGIIVMNVFHEMFRRRSREIERVTR